MWKYRTELPCANLQVGMKLIQNAGYLVEIAVVKIDRTSEYWLGKDYCSSTTCAGISLVDEPNMFWHPFSFKNICSKCSYKVEYVEV